MERIILKRIHATIPEPLYNKLVEMDKMHAIDQIITELLYDYFERPINKNGADDGRNKTSK